MSTSAVSGPMAKRLGYALKRAQHVLRIRMDEALRSLNVSTPQYAVLSLIEGEAGISSAKIARAGFVTPQTMHGILANLRRDGLVLREADPEHGRIQRSLLTPQGRKVLKQAHRAVREVENIMIRSLGVEEAEQMTILLMRCADALTDGPSGGTNATASTFEMR